MTAPLFLSLAAALSLGFSVSASAAPAAGAEPSVKELQTACFARSDAAACASLGVANMFGEGVPKNPRMAAELFGKACAGGSALGCFNLARLHTRGRTVERDLKKAGELYERGCQLGDAESCEESAHALRAAGKFRESGRRFEKACQLGRAAACTERARQYEGGVGTRRDEAAAGEWFGKACKLKDGFGCYALAMLYEQSLSLVFRQNPPGYNERTARRLYGEACQYGFEAGCRRLKSLEEAAGQAFR